MAENPEKEYQTYDVECGDGTVGRLSAKSDTDAQSRAGEMCKVHDGVKDQPTPQS